ncbi:MAG: hypothetical protein ACLR6W_08405 [Evtepia sp.]
MGQRSSGEIFTNIYFCFAVCECTAGDCNILFIAGQYFFTCYGSSANGRIAVGSNLNGRTGSAGCLNFAACYVDGVVFFSLDGVTPRSNTAAINVQNGCTPHRNTRTCSFNCGLSTDVHRQRIVGEDTSPASPGGRQFATGHIEYNAIRIGRTAAAHKCAIRPVTFNQTAVNVHHFNTFLKISHMVRIL